MRKRNMARGVILLIVSIVSIGLLPMEAGAADEGLAMMDVGLKAGYASMFYGSDLEFRGTAIDNISLSDLYKGGYFGGIEIIYWKSLGRSAPGFIGIGGDFQIIGMTGLSESGTLPTGETYTVNAKNLAMFPLTLSVYYRFVPGQKITKGKLTPYIGAGAGAYLCMGVIDIDVEPYGLYEANMDIRASWGYHFIGGLAYMLGNKTSIFGEFRWTNVDAAVSVDAWGPWVDSLDLDEYSVFISSGLVTVGLRF